MTSSINIYAGANALKKIQADGLSQEAFEVMAGASGGPKWFTLFGLDSYLFGEYFNQRRTPLHTIGSSAGAWRMACLAQQEPVKAIQRLAKYYSQETYSSKPSATEISSKADVMLSKVLGAQQGTDIVENSLIQSHFVVAKAKGLNQSENRLLQMLALAGAATANAISRKNIDRYFERFVFHTSNQHFNKAFFEFTDRPTQTIPLNDKNVHSALMASGAIPIVLNGIKNISGAPQGVYRDGGIIDYHFDINFNTEKLVLYPHFFPQIKPGWFDKSIKKRNAQLENYQNVVLVTPSASHVAALPYQKISDRKDFETLDETSRLRYWQKVIDDSHYMADDFAQLATKGVGINQIIPLESILV